MEFVVDHVPTYKEFIVNMEDKMQDDEFWEIPDSCFDRMKSSIRKKVMRLSARF